MVVLACWELDAGSFTLGVVTMTVLAVVAILWSK